MTRIVHAVRVLLISTYDLGRQPFGLASRPRGCARQASDVDCVDTSRDRLSDERDSRRPSLVAFYLPMHTATRAGGSADERVRRVNPDARLVAYGLYAPLNAAWLRERGVDDVLGPEAEERVGARSSERPTPNAQQPSQPPRQSPRLTFIQPDRTTLLPLTRYAALQMPDGTRRVVGSTDATRGCKHLCRHCPIVPVYQRPFRGDPDRRRASQDIRGAGRGGRRSTSRFGDPDFFNGPTHARRDRRASRARSFRGSPTTSTIKIEHLLQHADMLPLLRDTGCLFITSAVESIDDDVLREAAEGSHARGLRQRGRAVPRGRRRACRRRSSRSRRGRRSRDTVELLEQIAALDLDRARRADSARHPAARDRGVDAAGAARHPRGRRRRSIPASLTWPWRHADPAWTRCSADVDADRRRRCERAARRRVRGDLGLARERAGAARAAESRPRSTPALPYMTEAWYCCAEPGPSRSIWCEARPPAGHDDRLSDSLVR